MSQQSLMKMARCVACLVAMAMVGSVQAAWVMIDDFESGFGFDEGTQVPVLMTNGLNNWIIAGANDGSANSGFRHIVSDPDSSTNQVLRFFGGGGTGTAKQVTAGQGIADGGTGTVFLRFRMDNTTAMAFGLGLSTTASTATATAGTIGLGDVNTAANNTVYGFTGTTSTSAAATSSMDQDTWYSLWAVINNVSGTTADVVNLYIQGGAFATQTQLAAAGPITNFTSRGNLAGELLQVAFRPANTNRSTVNPPDGGILLIDDIYLDNSGQVLTNPVPEPTGILLFGIGIIAVGRLHMLRARSVKGE
jgi:hypothetical protein